MIDPVEMAESFVGTYRVEGCDSRGASYRGGLRLDRKGRFLHAEAVLDPLRTRHGLAMPFAGRLVMAVGPKDKVEIGAYTHEANQLRGLWVPPGAASDDTTGCGHEHSTSTGTGIWLIDHAIAIDGQPYSGSVTIAPACDRGDAEPCPVRIDWKLHDGEYHSFGLRYDDALYTTFSFEPEQPYGIIVYDLNSHSLIGTSLMSGDLNSGTETITRGS